MTLAFGNTNCTPPFYFAFCEVTSGGNMRGKWVVPLLLASLAAMAYVVNTVTLPSGTVVTVTATVSVINNTKYIIRTIVYNNTTVTDTITVVPMTGNLNAMLNKAPKKPVLPETMVMAHKQMREMHGNMTHVHGMGPMMGNVTRAHEHGMGPMTHSAAMPMGMGEHAGHQRSPMAAEHGGQHGGQAQKHR